ncbi:hypothetical protein [uncultured Pseudokineococcus sp.]|uniref:hypothetical protein n=1 Tax=uncultured Pseudokineococcus sp. TaxID=1642928 RepID=UPI0026350133|nr:hypothetical protein [uncultured Pseudokineococcus sp.]
MGALSPQGGAPGPGGAALPPGRGEGGPAVGGRLAVEHLRVLAPGEDFDPLT